MRPQGKNIVVTGGNNGVGYQTVKSLYEEGHNVIFGSRNVKKNEEAVQAIAQVQGGKVESYPLDLSKRKSVEEFANFVKGRFDVVDILVNNAGLMLDQEKKISELGIEMTLTINHFGHFLLTYLLFENLKKSREARIINVSSLMHYYAPKELLQDLAYDETSFGYDVYSRSKLFNVLFTVGLNDYFKDHGLKHMKTASLHPGTVDTGFGNQAAESSCCFACVFSCFKNCLGVCCFKNQAEGAQTSLHLCRIPFEELRSGEYYDCDTRHKEMDERGRVKANVTGLWKKSEEAYGIKF